MLKVFVYGALMNTKIFKRRGDAARLDNHQLSFTIKGLKPWEPAFAELIEMPGQQAWGVVAEVTVYEWHKLRRHEISYREKSIVVQTKENKSIECVALVQKAPHSNQAANPSARYMRILYRSAIYYQFPETTISYYEKLYEKGNPVTLYLPWVLPLTKLLIPYLGSKKSFYISFIGVPVLVFVALIAILYF